ncbi:MAG: protein kinase, partial [Alphaproteobacteria bacterium]|nr:protein kinase [Alphaproteobacteria bacterium]
MKKQFLPVQKKVVPLHHGTIKKYLKGKLLGKGGFAKCYEFKCLNNKKTYAVKIIDKATMTKSSTKSKLKSEIKIHRSMNHCNIVKFEHYFEDNENVYILLELCKNKTLNELLKRRKIISELEMRFYLAQILEAVKYMHANRVIHRDLKLGNLFLGQNLAIKIGDFGLATRIEHDGERKHTVCG